jgi:hypothetical protein
MSFFDSTFREVNTASKGKAAANGERGCCSLAQTDVAENGAEEACACGACAQASEQAAGMPRANRVHLPVQLKVASLKEAMMTPPTIGIRVSSTGTGATEPRNKAENMTLKKGSAACQKGMPSGTGYAEPLELWPAAVGARTLSP